MEGGQLDTLNFLLQRYNIAPNTPSPVQLPVRRTDLAKLFKELNYKVGAEIGVDRGLYSEVLTRENPQTKLYCIDPWKTYNNYPEHKIQNNLDNNYANTRFRLKNYKNCEILRMSSTGALKIFQPNTLDFVY